MPKGLQVSRMPPRKETESSGVEIAWKERRKKFVTRRSLSVMAYAFASILILVLVVRLFMITIPLWLNVSLLVTAVFMVYGWTVLRSQRRAVETEEMIRHHEEYFEEIENEHAKLKAQTVKKKAKLVPDIPAAKPAAASADTTSLKKRKKKIKSDLDGVEAEIADGLEDFCAHPSLKKHIQARVDEIESKARRKVEKEEERLAEERKEVERLEAEVKDAERMKEENRKEEERRRIKKQKDERRELRNKSSIDVAPKDIKPEDIEVVKKELEYYTRANAAVVAARETRIPAEVQKPEKKPRKMWQPKTFTEDPDLDAAASSSDIFLPTKISWHSESSGDRWGEETVEQRREKEWKSAGRNVARSAEWTRA